MTARADDDDVDPTPAPLQLPARAAAAISSIAAATLDLVIPPLCLACRKPLASHDALCATCWRQIRFISAPHCDRLGIPLSFDTGSITVSSKALANPPDYDRARAVAEFGPLMRTLVHAFKYQDRHDARRLFGRWLASAGSELLTDADILVPVPLHRWRLLRRKFNQSGLLALELSRLVNIPTNPFVLVRTRATSQQVGLTETARRRNVSGAFEVPDHARRKVAGRRIVLIDDVITTGNTVSACARALQRAGAARVDVLALALVTDQSHINV